MLELQEIQQFIESRNLLIKCDMGTSAETELKVGENQNTTDSNIFWSYADAFSVFMRSKQIKFNTICTTKIFCQQKNYFT